MESLGIHFVYSCAPCIVYTTAEKLNFRNINELARAETDQDSDVITTPTRTAAAAGRKLTHKHTREIKDGRDFLPLSFPTNLGELFCW